MLAAGAQRDDPPLRPISQPVGCFADRSQHFAHSEIGSRRSDRSGNGCYGPAAERHPLKAGTPTDAGAELIWDELETGEGYQIGPDGPESSLLALRLAVQTSAATLTSDFRSQAGSRAIRPIRQHGANRHRPGIGQLPESGRRHRHGVPGQRDRPGVEHVVVQSQGDESRTQPHDTRIIARPAVERGRRARRRRTPARSESRPRIAVATRPGSADRREWTSSSNIAGPRPKPLESGALSHRRATKGHPAATR